MCVLADQPELSSGKAVKSGVDRWKKGKRVSQPEFTSWSIVYDKRAATTHQTYVSLATVNGRIECPYILPRSSPTPYEQYVLGDDTELRTCTLQYDEVTDEFYYHIGMRAYDPESDDETDTTDTADTEHQTILGVDLGVNSLAVASTGRFWQGDDYDHLVREFEKRRGEMQQRGTQAAHDTLLRLDEREEAWRKQYIHTVANEISTKRCARLQCDRIRGSDRYPHASATGAVAPYLGVPPPLRVH